MAWSVLMAKSSRFSELLDPMDGSIKNVQKIRSGSRGDFNPNRDAFYFAIDYEVALGYAMFAKKRDRSQKACIVRLSLPYGKPNGVITALPGPEFITERMLLRNAQNQPAM
jgi:hypothetical protein